LTYDRITPDAPSSVILKTGLPERIGSGWNAGRQEVAFYTEVAATMSLPLVPCCFEAHWDAETETWRLLLEDLTESQLHRDGLAIASDDGAMRKNRHAAGPLPRRLVLKPWRKSRSTEGRVFKSAAK
jgi:hypothetical protein